MTKDAGCEQDVQSLQFITISIQVIKAGKVAVLLSVYDILILNSVNALEKSFAPWPFTKKIRGLGS